MPEHTSPADDRPELRDVPDDVRTRFALDRLPFEQKAHRVRDLLDLSGRRVLLTGGGGADLGQACAHRLAGEGATLALVDLDLEAATRVAKEVRSRWGATAIPVQGDVTDWDDAHRFVGDAAEALGGIDVLVNNAGGVMRTHAPFVEQGQAVIDRIVNLNLVGVVYTIRAVLDVMIPQGSGRIINIASEGGKIGMRNIVVYNACKSAVIGLTRNLAHELPDHGITIAAVCPAAMAGPKLLSRLSDGAAAASGVEQALPRLTIGRLELPDRQAGGAARGGGQHGGLPRVRCRLLRARHRRQRRGWLVELSARSREHGAPVDDGTWPVIRPRWRR